LHGGQRVIIVILHEILCPRTRARQRRRFRRWTALRACSMAKGPLLMRVQRPPAPAVAFCGETQL